jgi:hypothetical protein
MFTIGVFYLANYLMILWKIWIDWHIFSKGS